MFRYIIKLYMVFAISLFAAAALADTDATKIQAEATAASRSINEGHVKDGLGRLISMLKQLDPAKDKDAYWLVSTTVIEFLSQFEDHASAGKVLEQLIATKIPEGHPVYFPWMQFYIGRNLAFTGKADDAEKVLRALTGSDNRLVYNAPQRAAAFVLAQIALDRGNVRQSAIWMRRAVIGTLVDKGAGSEEIVDALTSYAVYLGRTRRLADAHNLALRLAPIYDANYTHHGSKYIKFVSHYSELESDIGNFAVADRLLKLLHTLTDGTDIYVRTAYATAFYGDLYQLARSSSTDGKGPLQKRLQEVLSAYPDFFSKDLRARVNLAYFALVGDDIELADRVLNSSNPVTGQDAQYESYVIALKSLIAARRNRFDESIALSRDALGKIVYFHNSFENESASYLPAISIPERAVLATITGFAASHAESYDNANAVFRLAQFLDRDKGKLGLNKKVVQQDQRSDLLREEVRSRDRLQELRDRLMYDAVDALLARIARFKQPSISKDNDYTFLTRLENIEDRIVTADERLRPVSRTSAGGGVDALADLREAQRLIRPNEALVTHVMALGVLLTTCVTSDGWEFRLSKPDQAGLQQITIDTKLLMAAVRGTHDPAPDLDSSFPMESANRLFNLYLGSINGCLKNKTHILLATDPDLFTLPWNALLTEPPPTDGEHPLRDASWLPKSYAISLLPSVRSLVQLRTNLGRSKAQQLFLGIGDPDFKGAPAPAAQLAIGPLFASRGVADARAIGDLPRLPESADELRAVARALGASPKDLLLQGDATERELRKRALNDYRVISFATHAIVSGEIDGVTEPALVLSPGYGESNPQNDGLLTAPEIQNLTLDANLVILSACNTAASDGQAGGRGLSGLADAFFFAGARSIAVTQWAVYSEFAQKLGVGMIAQSLKSGRPGVAQGLRQAMTSYLAGVTSDYLANPRFWAPFMIAGDGAVGPLDQASSDAVADARINVQWEHTTGETDWDLMGLAKSAANGSFYTFGIAKPPQGQTRNGSYIGRLRPDHSFEIVDRNTATAALNVTAVGQNLAFLGYLAQSPTSSRAEFRVLGKDHGDLWRFEDSGENWHFPTGLIKTKDGYAAISIETKFEQSDQNAVIISKLSEQGALTSQRRYPLPFSGISNERLPGPHNIVSDGRGHLIIAVSADTRGPPPPATKFWTNPQSGSRRFCVVQPETLILSIDEDSLDLRERRRLRDSSVAALRFFDGRVYAASNFLRDCRLTKSVRLSVLDGDLKPHSIYESANANGLEVFDFEVTPDRFILVGITATFAPTAVTTKTVTQTQLRNSNIFDPSNDSIWERTEERPGAFILEVGRDGAPQGDRVFLDLRSRRLVSIQADSDNRFVAAGSALGEQGWLVGFSIGDETSLTKRLQAAWRTNVILPVMKLLSARSK
jgi:CHAT domain-containing protein